MKTLSIISLIVLTLVLIFFNVGIFIPTPKSDNIVINNKELRNYALSHGLKPIPQTWKKAKLIVSNPNNPLSPKKISLGRTLFFDSILSRDETLTCASCHLIQDGGDDNRPTAIGYHNRANPKHLNSPTVLNAALAKREFWDGRSPNVEDQAKGPIQAPFEMNMTPKEIVKRVKKKDIYAQTFKDVFPKEGITFDTITKAIGAYERTLLTRGAYDRFLEGDDNAISLEAKKGLFLFMRLGCKGCHTGASVGGQSMQKFPVRKYDGMIVPVSVFIDGEQVFSKFKFQPIHAGSAPFPFEDIGGFHGKNNQFKFRVPILRNITRTAPYFHNGVVKDLKKVVWIMARHQLGISLSKKQIKQIIAFLKTLEGGPVDYNTYQ
jgi:cytochrome c peroxidase